MGVAQCMRASEATLAVCNTMYMYMYMYVYSFDSVCCTCTCCGSYD